MRLCKYALNLLLEIFNESAVAEDMLIHTHERLSQELLSHLTNVDELTARCVCACVHCVRACMRACVHACACVRACVRVCMRACVRACVWCYCMCVCFLLSHCFFLFVWLCAAMPADRPGPITPDQSNAATSPTISAGADARTAPSR